MIVFEVAAELLLGIMMIAMHIFKYVAVIFVMAIIIQLISNIKRNRTRKKYYGSKYNYYKYYNPKYREKQGRYSYVRLDKTAQKDIKQRIL